MRKGELWVIWVIGVRTWEMAGTAETNLAVEEGKGAVAMTRVCWGWEIGAALGTGASVIASRVVVSTVGASVASSSSVESLTSITTLVLS